MPLKLEIKVGTDSIVADGDFTIDEQVVNLTKEWVTALPKDAQQAAEQAAQAKIDQATGKLRGSQDALESNVAGHSFSSTVG
jgi:hypothetical protein